MEKTSKQDVACVYDYIRQQCENRPENIQYSRRMDGFEVCVMGKVPHTITMTGTRVKEMIDEGLCASQIWEYIYQKLFV